jgi:hypothetical protein
LTLLRRKEARTPPEQEAHADELGSTSGSEAGPDDFTVADAEEEEEEDPDEVPGYASGSEW